MTTATKERPILFTAREVRAALDGTLTQVRRVVKHDPHPDCPYHTKDGKVARCPFGVPGDRLWVKEDMYYTGNLKEVLSVGFSYGADCMDLELTASMRKRLFAQHMSRMWSRLTMEVTDVRAERLQDISMPDAMAEGVQWDTKHTVRHPYTGPVAEFSDIWDATAKPGERWQDNPWVWAGTLKRLTKDTR